MTQYELQGGRNEELPKMSSFRLWIDEDVSGKPGVDGIAWMLWMGYMLMTA